ncbi:MAG: hypothetical protein OEY94_07205 [Alphaproteobacteria bacterium]|nr:hypothetical protein [Alphaproteobacteria bacterium]
MALTDEFPENKYKVPDYSYIDVPVVIGQDKDGNYLVHNRVSAVNPSTIDKLLDIVGLSGIFDFARKEGTGDHKSDKVFIYTPENFNRVFKEGKAITYKTLEQYIKDAAALQPARGKIGHDTPVVEAADIMKKRIEEMGRDLKEQYELNIMDFIKDDEPQDPDKGPDLQASKSRMVTPSS